jgi:hypothetical protein
LESENMPAFTSPEVARAGLRTMTTCISPSPWTRLTRSWRDSERTVSFGLGLMTNRTESVHRGSTASIRFISRIQTDIGSKLMTPCTPTGECAFNTVTGHRHASAGADCEWFTDSCRWQRFCTGTLFPWVDRGRA